MVVRIVACLIAGVTLAGLAVAARTEPVRAAQRPYGIPSSEGLRALPATSCSAAACHGGGQVGRPGSEHSTWAPELGSTSSGDPHAKAYRTLFNQKSVRIASLLPRSGPAHKNELCLKCHAPAGVKDATARPEGVGCAACHGSSNRWLAEHYLPSWKAKSNRDKCDTGFVPTKNLTARILNCASCHIGSADREVNHDLIAAGHPRLAFEYTRFHYQPGYRQHWVERIPQPKFEVRAWTIGQAASLRTVVELLRSRAAKAARDKAPWPEFAEYSCYSCHHTIGKTAGVPGRSTGLPGWEVWYTSTFIHAADVTRPSHGEFTQLHRLDATMGKSHPKPAEVVEHASAALDELDEWLAALQDAEDRGDSPVMFDALPRLARRLAGQARAASDWDALASHYLGCAAMYHASGGAAANPKWQDPLAALRKDLEVPDRLKLESVRTNFGLLRDAAILPGAKR